MRLIDADNLFVHYTEKEQQEYGNDFEGGVLFACDAISKNAPTVDAVPVVRCKDCKYYLNSNEKCELIDTRLHFYETRNRWTDDDFCSWGERKGGDE